MDTRVADRLAPALRAVIRLGVIGLCLGGGQLALAEEAPAILEAVDLELTEPVKETPVEEAPAHAGGMYGPTTRDDTLWSIARKVRPDGLTVAETVSALQRMNPDAFLAGDPNRLMRGVMLRVPATAAETETSTAAETGEPDAPADEAPAPEWEEVLPQDDAVPPEVQDESPEMLALRNAELEERLQAVQTELDVATAKIGALEAQISTMRRRLADSETRAADAQSGTANDVGTTRRNLVTGVALAVLLVAVIAFLYTRVRGGRGTTAAEPAPQPLGARRIATGRLAPDAGSDDYASSTKLNLARAFVDMGRTEQAREVLEEVLAEGSEQERREAEDLLGRME